MESYLPSVGEASRSIRHGHVSVKDTHASLARSGLANPYGQKTRNQLDTDLEVLTPQAFLVQYDPTSRLSERQE